MQIQTKGNQEVEIEGRILKLTNLGKVFWSEEGYTKGDLINYYLKISSYILPYLKDRPESLHRYPNGIRGKSFYQKNVDHQFAEWLETADIYSEEGSKTITYLVINDLPSLIYAINLGCIDLNPWNSRSQFLDNPDYLIIDLDPVEIEYKYVVRTAQVVRGVLDKLHISSYPKTSGATGLHIYIPMGATYKYEKVRNFAEILVNLVFQKAKNFTSLERSPAKRKGRVYLDYLQNSRGQTLASPYCVRPQSGATISAPLDWGEVTEDLMPSNFTIKNIFNRLENTGDLFQPVLNQGINISEVLDNIK